MSTVVSQVLSLWRRRWFGGVSDITVMVYVVPPFGRIVSPLLTLSKGSDPYGTDYRLQITDYRYTSTYSTMARDRGQGRERGGGRATCLYSRTFHISTTIKQ